MKYSGTCGMVIFELSLGISELARERMAPMCAHQSCSISPGEKASCLHSRGCSRPRRPLCARPQLYT